MPLTITGSDNNDDITGGSGNDRIFYGLGNDTVRGGAGNDFIDNIFGSNIVGDDIIFGDAGNDTIFGGFGNDQITGGADQDAINSGEGNDIINLANGDFVAGESIDGGAATDELILTNATTVDFTTGTLANLETLTGSTGDDDITIEIDVLDQFATADLAGGTDTVRTLIDGAYDAIVNGVPTVTNAENGFLVGSANADTLTASGTDIDNLVYGAGTIDFGGNTDIINLTSTSANLNTLGLTDGSIIGLEEINASTAAAGVVIRMQNQSENFTITGSGNNDSLDGGNGDDTINGGDGIDSIRGRGGADIMDGGNGNDRFILVNGDFAAGESIDGGADTDEIEFLNATTVDFTTGTLSNVETLTGSTGNDDVTYDIETALAFTTIDLDGGVDNSRVQVNGVVDVTALGTPTVTNVENGFLLGSNTVDNLTISGAQLDSLVYGAGTINMGSGADTLNLTSTSANLNTLGATDLDITALERINASTAAGSVTLTLTGQTEGFLITGSANGDILTLGTGDDTINAGIGDDVINAGNGADNISAGNGNDTINLSNNHFNAGESIDGGADTDELILTNATTVDFTVGTLTDLENLTGSTGNDNVTLSIAQFFAFDAIDYAGGTDSQIIDVSGVNDVTALTTPTVTNLEGSALLFSAGVDDLTITGTQLDTLTDGATSIDALGGADALRITTTSVNLNTLGSGADGNIANLEEIDASGATAAVEISMSAQTEAFTLNGGTFADTITGGSGNDTIDGGDGDNILTGLDGDDEITGGTGNDTILGGDGNDILVGGAGDDTIFGATIIGESGVETVIQTNASTWHTVTFSAAILNPVVKMSNMTNNDGDFYVVRVRDVTENGFEYQIDEFDYLDGSRVLAEDVSWIAISEGTHTLENGSIIQAGTTTATNEAETVVAFNSAFGTAPVVMTQVMSDNDSAAVGTRNRNRTASNFRVQMLEEENADGIHATEEIGWIAIDNGGSVGSGFLVGETGNSVTHVVTTVTFPTAFDNTPVVLHDQQTRDGGDTSYSQADGVTTGDARFFVGEEQSRDAEVTHTTEVIGYYALNEGLITSAGAGDNDLTGGALDLSDILGGIGGINAGNIADYVNLNDISGTDTIVEVDRDGTGGGFAMQEIAIINGITGLDEATLFTNGNIVV